MKVYKEIVGKLQTNSYIVTQDNKNCIIIDLGDETPLQKAKDLGLDIKAVLLTHGHADHIYGCYMAKSFGAEVFICEKELKLYQGLQNLGAVTGMPVRKFNVDGTFKDGDILEIANLKIEVLETAGHTEGSVTFKIEDCLFTGDTMFAGSYGRTDFPSGDENKMFKSLQRLCGLKGDYKVYSGHGEETTLDYERDNYKF